VEGMKYLDHLDVISVQDMHAPLLATGVGMKVSYPFSCA